MGNLYYDLAAILRAAGCQVSVGDVNAGWERRARSSGGFVNPPLGVWWHHTASSTSPESDLNYMINGSSDEPVGNVLLDRDGVFWPIAGGACNCAGKGGPWTFSRGTCPKDAGNTYGFQIECANNGVGEPWSEQQVSAFIRGSNALNAHVGNQATDVVTHHAYAPDRKIDPAVAGAVRGPWVPRSINSSGTWNLDDIRGECAARAGETPPPPVDPPPPDPVPSDWWTPLMESLPVLRQGNSGIQVKKMQHLLAAAGFMKESNVSNYDGQFGSGTTNALNSFKQAAGGGPDGVCDSWTWGALLHTVDGIPTITKGQSGPDVKRMQHLLAACGFMNEANTSNYDGRWGDGTENAKIKFDNASGLTPSPPTDCGKGSWTALLT